MGSDLPKRYVWNPPIRLLGSYWLKKILSPTVSSGSDWPKNIFRAQWSVVGLWLTQVRFEPGRMKTVVMRMSKNGKKPWNQFRMYFWARQHQHSLNLIENFRNAHVEKWSTTMNQFRIYFWGRQHQHFLSLIENCRNAHVEKCSNTMKPVSNLFLSPSTPTFTEPHWKLS